MEDDRYKYEIEFPVLEKNDLYIVFTCSNSNVIVSVAKSHWIIIEAIMYMTF